MKRLLLLVVLALGLAGCSHTGGSESNGVPTVELVGEFKKGEAAPKIVATDFEGNRVDVSQFYGEKAVILDFWAAWCPFCVAEMPELQATQDKYGNDLVMIGIHRSETEKKERGKEFADERGVTYLLLQDDGNLYNSVTRVTGIQAMPIAVFIDKSGVVTDVKSGPKTKEEIAERVAGLLE